MAGRHGCNNVCLLLSQATPSTVPHTHTPVGCIAPCSPGNTSHPAPNHTSHPQTQHLTQHLLGIHMHTYTEAQGIRQPHRINSSTSTPLLITPAMSVQRMPSIHSITTTRPPHKSRLTHGILTVGSAAKLRPNSSILRASCSLVGELNEVATWP